MNSKAKDLEDYLAVFRRRKAQFFAPALVVFIVATLAALLWPPTYRSSAVVLIEEPDVPRDMVQSTISSYASERIQVITQRVLTTSNLVGIIEKYGLYKEQRERSPTSVVVEDMREDMNLEMINAEVIDPRSGRPSTATIAFEISFDHRSSVTAQRILNELVSLYLAENIRSRTEKAAETTEFLVKEAKRYGDLVNQLEAKLADFKERYAGSLPDEMPINLQMLERTDREVLEIRREIQAAEERRIYLEAQLSQVDPYQSLMVDGRETPSPATRLEALQTEFISLSGVYGPDHPDVRKLAREIKALDQEVGGVIDVSELERRRQEIETELSASREQYSSDHPDVMKLQRQLETIEAALMRASDTENKGQRKNPNNPAYIQLAAEIEALDAEMRSLNDQRATLRNKLQVYETRLSRAPKVERDYLLLKRDYENALATYREVKGKLTAAEIGQSLEQERKGEQLSLIEPPREPTTPVKPNRLAILLVGIALSLGAGIGSVALFESTDHAIYGPLQLAAVTGSSPLVVIGHIRNRAEQQRIWARRIFVPLGMTAATGAVMLGVNEFVMPLEVLWFRAEREMELLLIEMGFI